MFFWKLFFSEKKAYFVIYLKFLLFLYRTDISEWKYFFKYFVWSFFVWFFCFFKSFTSILYGFDCFYVQELQSQNCVLEKVKNLRFFLDWGKSYYFNIFVEWLFFWGFFRVLAASKMWNNIYRSFIKGICMIFKSIFFSFNQCIAWDEMVVFPITKNIKGVLKKYGKWNLKKWRGLRKTSYFFKNYLGNASFSNLWVFLSYYKNFIYLNFHIVDLNLSYVWKLKYFSKWRRIVVLQKFLQKVFFLVISKIYYLYPKTCVFVFKNYTPLRRFPLNVILEKLTKWSKKRNFVSSLEIVFLKQRKFAHNGCRGRKLRRK